MCLISLFMCTPLFISSTIYGEHWRKGEAFLSVHYIRDIQKFPYIIVYMFVWLNSFQAFQFSRMTLYLEDRLPRFIYNFHLPSHIFQEFCGHVFTILGVCLELYMMFLAREKLSIVYDIACGECWLSERNNRSY